ncbi:MAG: capsule assembly Wzi family protein [Muribaculaceae bacterium]|nr:capsule assembly Wzi family protein [Muribaculaceae bacterium]
MVIKRFLLPAILSATSIIPGHSFELNWEASTTANVGSGPFAPSLIMNNRAGTITQSKGIYERASIFAPLQPDKRFSFSFAVDGYIQATSAVDYRKYDATTGEFSMIPRRPAAVTLQQLSGLIKYRSLFLMAGMKENDRTFLNNPLSSGDMTVSNNARPIPQVRIGFYDFVNIPLTKGWVQIIGDIAYGKFTDAKWNTDHYNFYNSFITTGVWYHYKRLYLRTNPSKPFSVTVGMQHATQFGGYWRKYSNGEIVRSDKEKVNFKSFINAFVQKQYNNSDIDSEALNFLGNHLGSWDVNFRYRLRNNDEISFYVMKPWEDGTGIGWQNGFDGVWGLAYKSVNQTWIKGAVIEYLDFTNQAGPFMREPSDKIPYNPVGADNYYNNFKYNSWMNYGLAIGNPAIRSTIYNTDGYLEVLDNDIRGFHLGVDGEAAGIDWRVLLSYKESKGTHYAPRPKKLKSTSMMIGGTYEIPKVKGLKVNAQLGFDAGDLYPGCFGMLFNVSYSGKIFSNGK